MYRFWENLLKRQTDEQTKHDLEDPCSIYDSFVGCLIPPLYNSSLHFFLCHPFPEKKDIEHLWNYEIIAVQSSSYE